MFPVPIDIMSELLEKKVLRLSNKLLFLLSFTGGLIWDMLYHFIVKEIIQMFIVYDICNIYKYKLS